jgi:thioredoxin reductase
MHGYLSRDGMPPAVLVAAGRGFTVHRGDDQVLAARRIVVATGIGDELPDISGVREHDHLSLSKPLGDRFGVRR